MGIYWESRGCNFQTTPDRLSPEVTIRRRPPDSLEPGGHADGGGVLRRRVSPGRVVNPRPPSNASPSASITDTSAVADHRQAMTPARIDQAATHLLVLLPQLGMGVLQRFRVIVAMQLSVDGSDTGQASQGLTVSPVTGVSSTSIALIARAMRTEAPRRLGDQGSQLSLPQRAADRCGAQPSWTQSRSPRMAWPRR